MAYVVVYTAEAPAQKIKLEGPVIVGRGLGCGIWVDDIKLSRQHCRIEQIDRDWVVTDLDSSNGTWLNDKRIERARLMEGGMLEVGHVTIVFRTGRFVGSRPADPLDPSTRAGETNEPASDPSNSTVVDQPSRQARTLLPVPKPDRAENPAVKPSHVSLAFQRPPARPIVCHELPAERETRPGSERSSWIKGIKSRLRKR